MSAHAVTPLGRPIPDVPHAVSVSMPTWADVLGYEEGDPRVVDALQAGYPRFVFHPQVKALIAAAEEALAGPGERVLVLPSAIVAERCLAYLARHGASGTASAYAGVFAVRLPAAAWGVAKQFWQHAGEIVSSRRAAAALAGRGDRPDAAAVRTGLRARVAAIAGMPAPQVSLYPSGMAALAQALRLMQALHPGRPTAQLGFPYIDTLKLQQRLGEGAAFYPHADAADLATLARQLAAGMLAGVFLELPGNPLMRSVDLARVAALTRAAGVPLVVDDSTGTFFNHDFEPYADVLVASLTKAFSGNGDALGGALVLNPASPLHDRLAAAFGRGGRDGDELLFGDDAEALLRGSADFEARMSRINRHAELIADALTAHPAVERVYHPKHETPELYRTALRPHGGYGGMFSLLLRDAAHTAPRFYDRLAVQKGPSFGLRTTLACPYTLLAHYQELDWAEACGVSRHLVRVSVGLEDPVALLACFEHALGGGKSARRV